MIATSDQMPPLSDYTSLPSMDVLRRYMGRSQKPKNCGVSALNKQTP